MKTNTFDEAELASEIDRRIQALPDTAAATVRTLRREYSKRVASYAANEVVGLALQLLKYATFTHQFIAYELVHYHRPALQSLGETELRLLGRNLDSWVSVDTYGLYLAGPAWREGQVPDRVIDEWASDDDRWYRRTALVCTVALNLKARGGTGDTPRTLAICRQLADDDDDMVVKALSWALRELSRRDPDAVRNFLAEYDHVLAARVKREVNNKLATGLKNPK
jgi:3-methyladenine DNA glycosylase AlkD